MSPRQQSAATDLKTLYATVERLEAEVAFLRGQADTERRGRTRRQKGTWALLVALMALLCFGAGKQTTPQTLVCKRVELVGDDGKTRMRLSSDGDGGYMDVFGTNGQRCAYIGARTGGGGLVNLNATDGKARVIISGPDSGGNLNMLGTNGKTSAGIAALSDGNGNAWVADKDANIRAQIGALSNGTGYSGVYNNKNEMVGQMSVWSDVQGGFIRFKRPGGEWKSLDDTTK